MADIVLTGDTSGSITVAAPAVAGTNTLTLPASTGTLATTATAGKILQVVSTTKTDTFTTNTALPSAWEVTGGNATITPSSTSSKILVLVSGGMGVSTANYAVGLKLYRDSTQINLGDARGSAARVSNGSPVDGTGWVNNFAITHLDSPSTTSAITYKLYLGVEGGSTIYAFLGGSYSSGASYQFNMPTNIILMEVAA